MNRGRFVLITGTDTDVGKTVTTAALAVRHRLAGHSVAVVKPTQTGVGPGEPGDLAEVSRLSGVEETYELVRLSEPLAPSTAARRAGITLPSVQAHAQRIAAISDSSDTAKRVVLVEGAGGVMVGLDHEEQTFLDLAVALNRAGTIEVIVVARAGLGTLNHTRLTVDALRARDLPVSGLVIGAWPPDPDLAMRCNREELAEWAGAPLLAVIPTGAGRLDREQFAARSPGWWQPVPDRSIPDPD